MRHPHQDLDGLCTVLAPALVHKVAGVSASGNGKLIERPGKPIHAPTRVYPKQKHPISPFVFLFLARGALPALLHRAVFCGGYATRQLSHAAPFRQCARHLINAVGPPANRDLPSEGDGWGGKERRNWQRRRLVARVLFGLHTCLMLVQAGLQGKTTQYGAVLQTRPSCVHRNWPACGGAKWSRG